MNESKLLQKLALVRKNPELTSQLSEISGRLTDREISELMLAVITYVKEIRRLIEEGRLKGDKGDKGNDGFTPRPDKEYLALATAEKNLTRLFDDFSGELRGEVKRRLDAIRDGEDAVITDDHIDEAVRRTLEKIELPDFQSLITAEPTAIRNALELLQGDERLEATAIKGLDDTLKNLTQNVQETQRAVGSGPSVIAIQENGTTVARGKMILNFGAGVTATEANGVITITAGATGTRVQETPTGTIDSSNATFTLSHTPTTGTLVMYLNGQFVHPDDYTLTGDTIVFDAPLDVSFSNLPFTAIYEYA